MHKTFSLQDLVSLSGGQTHFIFSFILATIVAIGAGVRAIILVLFLKGAFYRREHTATYYEKIWLAMPCLIIAAMVGPGLSLLYSHERGYGGEVTVKSEGFQWYWGYEFRDFENISYERFISPQRDLPIGGVRNLDTDSRLILPINTPIQILITRGDVIHS